MEANLVSVLISAAVALAISLITFRREERRMKSDFDLDRDKLRTGFMAEQVAKQLLEVREAKRSFNAIKKRLGGFEDNELRQILVRAGAVCFEKHGDNAELWGLLSRNREDF